MTMISSAEYLNALQWRYACKKFNPAATIDPQTWQTLLESLRLSPSSLGLQLWKFVIVDNPALRERLKAVSWNQSQVSDCSHYVVLCGKRNVSRQDIDRYISQIEQIRHPSPEKLAASADFYMNYVNSMSDAQRNAWVDCQVYLAAGFLLSGAAALQVDSCAIGGMDAAAYDDILQLTASPYRTVLGVALGYRASDDAHAQDPKVRFPSEQIFDIRA